MRLGRSGETTTATGPEPVGDRLAASRRVDWRFLTPEPSPAVAAVGPATTAPVRAGLAAVCGRVAQWEPGQALPAGAGLLVVCDPTPALAVQVVRAADGVPVLFEVGGRVRRARLARRLRSAGRPAATYGLWPRRERATMLVPFADRAAVAEAVARVQGGAIRRTLTLLATGRAIGLAFSHAVLVVADHPGSEPAVVRAVTRAGVAVIGQPLVLTPRFLASRHVVVLTRTAGRGPGPVAKTPRLADDTTEIDREAAMLARLPDPGPSTAERAQPWPRLHGVVEEAGHRWLVEDRLAGPTLTRADAARRPDAILAAVRQWLARLPVGPASPPRSDGRALLLEAALRHLADLADATPELRPLHRDATAAVARLQGEPLPVVFEHGDLRPPNLLDAGHGQVAVVDWELAEPEGLPLHDMVHVARFLAEQAPGFDEQAALRGEAERLGVSSDLVPALISVAWLRRTVGLAERGGDRAGGGLDPGRLAVSEPVGAWRRVMAAGHGAAGAPVGDGTRGGA